MHKDRHERKVRQFNPTYRARGYQASPGNAVLQYFRTKVMYLGVAAAGVVLLLIGIILFGSGTKSQAESSEVEAQSGMQIEVRKPNIAPMDEASISNQVNAVINANPQLDMGVSIVDIETDKTYMYGVDVPFIGASVSKLLTASYFLNQVEAGKLDLEQQVGGQTARVQIQKMIAQSDNTAWRSLNDLLTKPAIESYAHDNGLSSYNSTDNTIKPSDVSLLLKKLYEKQILSEDHTSFLLANMQQDQEEIQFIRKYINPGVAVYHKAGWLSDRAHDTAIIENEKRPYILVIFTKARFGNYDFAKGQQLFSTITTAVQTEATK